MTAEAILEASNKAFSEKLDPTPQLKRSQLQLGRKLVIVSNREPYSFKATKKGLKLQMTAGGLVSALDPIVRENHGRWICWEQPRAARKRRDPHRQDELDAERQALLPYEVHGVPLTEREMAHYYDGYANQQLWPLCHYFLNRCEFNPKDWHYYQRVNEKFASAVLTHAASDELVWVQDYHLLLVPGMIREQDPTRNIAFFSHIPFPNVELFRVLPNRIELLRGMLGSDLIGFHIPSYVNHFLNCAIELLPNEVRINDIEKTIHYQGRTIQVGAFPISVDVDQILADTLKPTVQNQATRLRESYSDNIEFIGMGVDRLDYTKGIPERLQAIEIFFEKYPEYRRKLMFIQIAAPTRTQVPEYQELRDSIEQQVGHINGRFSEGSWSPIQYINRSLPHTEMIPYFLISDFALITPLRDGMNLVAKEYCVAKTDNSGALILSELTGAASQLDQAYTVNPYNPEEVADQIFDVLQASSEEKQARMAYTRRSIQEHDIYQWVQQYLTAFYHVVNQP